MSTSGDGSVVAGGDAMYLSFRGPETMITGEQVRLLKTPCTAIFAAILLS